MAFQPTPALISVHSQIQSGRIRFERTVISLRYFTDTEERLPLNILRGYRENGEKLVESQFWTLANVPAPVGNQCAACGKKNDPTAERCSAKNCRARLPSAMRLVTLTFHGMEFSDHLAKLEHEHREEVKRNHHARISPQLAEARSLYEAFVKGEDVQFYVVEGEMPEGVHHREAGDFGKDFERIDSRCPHIAALIVRLRYATTARSAERTSAATSDISELKPKKLAV